MDVIRMVVVIIGLVVLVCVVGIVYLVTQDRSVPGTLETIVVAGVTGLLGLLAPSRA